MANGTKILGVIVAVVIVIAAIGLYSVYGSNKGAAHGTTTTIASTSVGSTAYTTSVQSGPQSVSAPVMITDPAYAPANVKAVVVSYSNVMVHTKGSGSSGWVDAQGSGAINLTSATAANSNSRLMAYANVSSGTIIDMVRYNIDSAYVVVNGTAHNVAVSNATVTASVTGSGQLNQSSGVLVDITPTVVATYGQNTIEYQMSSSSSAVVLANSGVSSNARLNSSIALSANAKAQVESSAPSIQITGATITNSGNSTNVSVTVKNNANTSVTLGSVILYGPQTASTSQALGLNLSVTGGLLGGSVNGNANAGIFSGLLLDISGTNMVAFGASSGGSLSLLSNGGASGPAGVVVAPGGSTTLAYSGKISYDSGLVQSRLDSDMAYNVVVTGSGGASAESSTTAN